MFSVGTLDPVNEHGALRADMSSPLPSRSTRAPNQQAEERRWLEALSGCVGTDLSAAKTPHRRARRPRATPAEATSEGRSCEHLGAAPSFQIESEKKDETVFLDLTGLSSSEGESPTSTRGRRMHGQSQCRKKRSSVDSEGVENDRSQTNSLLRSLSFLRKTERKPEAVPQSPPREARASSLRGETGEHESGGEDEQRKEVLAVSLPRVARPPGCQQATESGGLRRKEGDRSKKQRKRKNVGGETEESHSVRADAEVSKRPSRGVRCTQCWVDKYGPQAVEDLLQPPQKIQQMIDFLKPFAGLPPRSSSALYPPASASLAGSDVNGVSSPCNRDGNAAQRLSPERLAFPLICVLQGPSGSGKRSLVSVVAAFLGFDLVEWEEETPDVSARSGGGGGGTEEVSNSSLGHSLLRFLSQAQSKAPLATLTMPAALGRLHACARLSRDVRTPSDDGVGGAEKASDACRAPQTAAKAFGAAWSGRRVASSVSEDAKTSGCDFRPSTSSYFPSNTSDCKAPRPTQCGPEPSQKPPRHVALLRHLPVTLLQRSPAFVRKAAAYLENLLAMHAAGQRAAHGTEDGKVASSRFQPLVICVGSSREESQGLQKILPSSALGHNTGVLHIKLNPVPTAKLRHFLLRVLMDEGILPQAASRSSLPASKVSALLATLPPSLDLLSILHLSNGDVRHALTSLQFAAADASIPPPIPSSMSSSSLCSSSLSFSSSVEDMTGEEIEVSLSGIGGASDRESSRSLSGKSRRERNRRGRGRGGAVGTAGRRTMPEETTETGVAPVAGREAGEQSSLEGGKDGRWGLFHALGKVLYNKRLIRPEQTCQTPSEAETSNTPDGRIRHSPATPYASSCSSFVSSASSLSSSSFVSPSSLSSSPSFSTSPSFSCSSVFPSLSSSSSPPSLSSPALSAPLRSGCTESLGSDLSESRNGICDPPAVSSADVASTSLTGVRPLCICRVFPRCDVGEKKVGTERRVAEINAARPEEEEVLRARPGVYTAGPSAGAAELADLELADLDDIFDAMDFLSDLDGDSRLPLTSPVSSVCSASLSFSASSPCAPPLSSSASHSSFSRQPPLASLECPSVSPAVPASASSSSSFAISFSSSSSSSSSSPTSSSSLSSSLPPSLSVASSLPLLAQSEQRSRAEPSQAPLSVGGSAQDALLVRPWVCGVHTLEEESPERAQERERCACPLVLRREEATVTREEAEWMAGGDTLHAYALFDGLCSSFLWPLRPRTPLPFSRQSTADSPLATPPSSSASSLPCTALPSSSRSSSSLSSPTLSSSSESSFAAVVAHAPWRLLVRKPTRPALYFSPEKLLEETPCDLDHFALLLQENFLFFFADVADVAAAAAHLADADALFGRTGLYSGQGIARDGEPGTPHLSLLRSWFFALVASRGILDSNTHPCSPGSWPESGRAAVSRLPPSFFSFKRSRALVLRRQLSTRIHVWCTYSAGVQRGLGDLVSQLQGAEATAGDSADRRFDSLDFGAEPRERTLSGACRDCERNALSLPQSSRSLRFGPQTERHCTGDTPHASGVHTPEICRPPNEPGVGRGEVTVEGLTALSGGSERCQGASQQSRWSAEEGSRGAVGLPGNREGDKTVAYMKTMWRGMNGVFGLSASRFFTDVLPFVTNRARTLQRREKTTPWPAARRTGERAAAAVYVDPHAASGRGVRVSRHPEESESRSQQANAGAGKERETASLFSRGCLDYLCGLEAPILERLRCRESWEKWGRSGDSQRVSGSAYEPAQRRPLALDAEDDEEEPDPADALLEAWGGFLPLPASLQAARDLLGGVATPDQRSDKLATAPTLSGFSHRSIYASRERTDVQLSSEQRPPSVSTWQCASGERKIGGGVQILRETEDDDIEDA